MKKRFLLLFAGMMLLVGSIWARPVDAAKARAVAETWMRAKGMAKVSSLVDVTAQTPFTEFYVFAAPDGGFILVSGDDCVIPVLGYSTHNRFEAKEIPAHVLSWLRSYEKEIRYWKKQESRAAAQNLHSLGSAEQWGMLERGAMPLTTLSSSVAPLMTTTWNQSPLYNRFCPTNGGDDDRAVTGCVATATAQVMKYHNYPAQGYGSFTYNSYRVINDVEYAYNNLTANFGATTYQWNNMPNALTSASSDAEINAVATLMYHIGVADSMRYSPHASGAQNYNTIGLLQPTTQTSLMKYFKYRPDMAAVSRDDYEHETFTSILRAELDQSRPILFSGSDEEGGHSFVLDGYNTDGYFHVNWGWAGWYDDYYVIGGLEPAGGGIGANMGSYNLNDVALIGIRPNTNWSTTGTTVVTATSSLASATVLGGGTYNFGSTVTLAAEAPEGYRFERWSDNDHFNPRQIYANGGSYSFNATFSALGGDTLSFCGNKGMISAYRLSYPFWGVKLPSSVMDASKHLNAVQFYVGVAGTYTLRIYTGADHSTLAATTVVSFSEEDVPAWHTINLPQPVAATQDIWIMVSNPDDTYWRSFTYCSGRPEALVIGTDEDNFYELGALDSWSWSAMIKGIFTDNSTPDLPLDTNTCVIISFPYSENFDGDNIYCWSLYDLDEDADYDNGYNRWFKFNGAGYDGTKGMGIVNLNENTNGDYIMGPLITTPGTYTASWKAHAYFGTQGPLYYYKMAYGLSENTETVSALDSVTSTDWVTQSFVFTVNEGDTVRFAIDYVTYAGDYFFIDDFSIVQGGSVPQPTYYTITANSNNSDWGTVTGGGSYQSGTTATLTATANTGYHFVSWQDGNQQNPRTITVTGNATYTANFAEDETPQPTYYTITVNSNNDQWGMVTGSGTYQSGETVTLTATANTGYHFVSWQDGNQQNPRTITVTGNATYTATFAEAPDLPLDTNTCVINTFPYFESFEENRLLCWYRYDVNQNNYSWSRTTGYGVNNSICWYISGQNECNDYLITPYINTPGEYTLEWKVRSWSEEYPEDYQVYLITESEESGEQLLLSDVVASSEYVTRTANFSITQDDGNSRIFFVYTSDGTKVYLFLDDFSIRNANAPQPTTYTIVAQPNDMQMGYVTGGGTFVAGATTTLTANALEGCHFVNWNDGSMQNPRTITVTGNATYTANFAEDETPQPTYYTITVNSNNDQWGMVTGSGTYQSGETVTLTATANTGYHFVSWQDGNQQNPRTITVTGNATYTATFAANATPGNCDVTTLPWNYSFITDSISDCWTNIDADGDGLDWTYYPNFGAVSFSYISDGQTYEYSLTPDNWLISPKVTLPAGGAEFHYTYINIAANYPDHIGVFVSTTNTDPSSFTLLEEYTAVAADTAWHTRTVSLAAYAGQQVYIAIRHYNSDDNYAFVVGSVSVTAGSTPVQNYTITANANNNSWGTVTGGGTYQSGATVTLTATANTGYHFVQWQDGNQQNPRTVTVTGNATYTATFAEDVVCLAVNSYPYNESFDESLGCWTAVDGNNDNNTWQLNTGMQNSDGSSVLPHSGNGMAASFSWNGDAFNVNEYLVSPQFVLPSGQTITLSWWYKVNGGYPEDKLAVRVSTTGNAVANFTATLVDITPTEANGTWTQYTLDLSSYAGQSIYLAFHHHDSYDKNYILLDDVQITAAAQQPPTQYTLTVVSANTNMGTATGSGTYDEGSQVEIRAISNPGYHFVSWSDNNTDSVRTVTVTANATYIATFAANPAPVQQYTLTVMSANTNMGTVTGGGTYDEGSQVEIRAISNPGYHFVSWSDNNTDSVRTVTVNSNATYIATFEQNNVGIDDRNLSDILLYPNPASSSVTLSGIDVEATVTLLDLNGREGASWRVTDGAITLDVSELVRGTYFLRIVTDSTTVVRKLIIK